MEAFFRPVIFNNIPQLIAAQSTRHGGVSPAPYHSLNLGKNTADQPENIAENKRRFCTALGFEPNQLAWSNQVHGVAIRLVTAPGGAEGFDALITNTPDVVVAVSVADCTPVLVYDTKSRAVAAVHAGWRGAAGGIVGKTLQAMAQEFGTRGSDCLAYVGTCIDECSFEVGTEVAVEFAGAYKRFDAGRGKYFVDLKKVCAQQLLDFGLPENRIEVSPFSTVLHNTDYFSHRKEGGVTGRMLAVIGLIGNNR
ncbi:MAG: peptidoglycan editing factor PgeF [Lewinellaceae bacterium]|nr:peptidoglycan editing factor PgeF [Lewinellaceae bacterium]